MKVGWLVIASLLTLPLAAPVVAAPDAAEQKAGAELDEAQRQIALGHAAEGLAHVQAAREAAGDKVPWVLVRALLLEGYAHAKAGEWVKAAKAFEALVDGYGQWPQVPEALLALGHVRRAAEQMPAARAAWTKLVEVAPHSLERLDAERLLLEADLADGNPSAAEKRMTAYLGRFAWHQDAPPLMLEVAQGWLAKGDGKQALAWVQRVRQDYPGSEASFSARRPLVEALRLLKRTDEALKALDEAATQAPEMYVVTDVANLRADLLAEQQAPAAVAALDELVKRYPGTFVAARALARQAAILGKAGDEPGASARLKLLHDQFSATYWRVQTLPVIADYYQTRKQWDPAEDALTELIKLTEGTAVAADALLKVADVQRAAGRKKSARKSLEIVVQTYKGPPVVPLAQQTLQDWEAEDAQKK